MTEQDDVVWTNTVDRGEFRCEVTRTGAYSANLVVTVVATSEVLLHKAVDLPYEAIFGPDVADVNEWMGLSIIAIDEWVAKERETGRRT